jgi:sugar/nucleoside kinase (ribokinase family)
MGPGKLLIAGYLSIDTVTDAAGRSRRMPGGACLYAGLGALHAGAEVALAASVGADYPDFWIEALALAGLDLAHLIRKNTLSRHADIRHFADGRRVSAHYRDPEWWVSSAEHAPEWPADLSGVGILVAGPMPVSRLARLVEDARGQGVPVVADTSEAFARADPGGILQLVPALSVFAPSREETRLLYPGMGDEDAARRLSSMGPAVVQKLGADGLRVVTSGGRKILHLPALGAEVVDPTGAGDATVGALAAGLLAGLDIADAARVALEAGALAVSGEGPSALGIKFSNAAPQGAALELE